MTTQVYDPDLGPVVIKDFPIKDVPRWKNAENQGQWFAYPEDGAPQYHEVFMLVLGDKVRFVGHGGNQYGPQHAGLYPAVCWAFGHGWIDPGATPEHNVACQVEMRCNSQLLQEPRGPLGHEASGTEARRIEDALNETGQ